jgi:hypothetical protein
MSHERTDIKIKPIGVAIAILVAVTIAVHVGVWFLFEYLRDEQGRRDVRRSLIDTRAPVPPEPRLQVDPYKDFNEYRRSQQRIMENYDWASREQGRVRIPIERAMELLAEQEKQGTQKTQEKEEKPK